MKNIRANDQNCVTVPLSAFTYREDNDILRQKLEAARTAQEFVDIANEIFDLVRDWYILSENENYVKIVSYEAGSDVYYICADKNKYNYQSRIINACTKLLIASGVDKHNAIDVLDAISMLLTNKHIQKD